MSVGKDVTGQIIRGYMQRLIDNAEAYSHSENAQLRKYAVISTPRVGSTMLCKQIEKTRVLGWPSEWFNQRYIKAYMELTGNKSNQLDFDAYVSTLIQGTVNTNSILGVNFHVEQYLGWKKMGIDLLDRLSFDKIYWIERKDKIKQSYSLVKATKTEAWSKDIEEKIIEKNGLDEVDITPGEVALGLANICQQCAYFEGHIRSQTEQTFYYEDFAEDNAFSAIRHIAEDFSLPSITLPDTPSMGKQSNDTDREKIAQIKEYFFPQGAH